MALPRFTRRDLGIRVLHLLDGGFSSELRLNVTAPGIVLRAEFWVGAREFLTWDLDRLS